MPRYFGPDGKEIPAPVPKGELIHLTELGGDVEEASVSLTYSAPDLDAKEVTRLIGAHPTRAWNAGDLRAMPGTSRTGIMRSDDYGLWQLHTERSDRPADEQISDLLSECTSDLGIWRDLSDRYQASLAVVAHAENWNREVHLSASVLQQLAERGLRFWVDIYFSPAAED
jgi:hypothetical protein